MLCFLCEIRRKSDHVLRAEPVGIEIGKTERFIQCDRRRVSLDNLKICFRCTEPDSLGEDCAADRGSVVAVAVRRMHMDGIDTDVIAVADAKPVATIVPVSSWMEVQMVSFGIARYIEGTTMRCITFVVLFKAKRLSIHFGGIKLLTVTATAGSFLAKFARSIVMTCVVCWTT